MREVNAAIEEMRREHDPLASHIFVSRRQLSKRARHQKRQTASVSARLSWQQACDLGFRGILANGNDCLARRLGHHGQREIVPIAAFVTGLEIVAVHVHNRSVPQVMKGADNRARGSIADHGENLTFG